MGPRRARAVTACPEAGFSLLEVLVAMMILSIGAASVLSLFAAAVNTHRRAVDRTRAALVAERLFSEVQGRYTVGKELPTLQEELRREVASQFGDYRWELYLVQPALVGARVGARASGARAAEYDSGDEPRLEWHEQELLVRVLVRWKRSGHNRGESFHTILLPRNVPGTESAARAPLRKRSGGLLLKR